MYLRTFNLTTSFCVYSSQLGNMLI